MLVEGEMTTWITGFFAAGALGLGAITAIIQCDMLVRAAAVTIAG